MTPFFPGFLLDSRRTNFKTLNYYEWELYVNFESWSFLSEERDTKRNEAVAMFNIMLIMSGPSEALRLIRLKFYGTLAERAERGEVKRQTRRFQIKP